MTDSDSAQIESRLRDLEKKVDELKPKKKDRWDKVQIAASLISPLVTFGLGFFLIQLATLGLERQKFQISSVKELQTLLSELRKPETSAERAEDTALSIAAFGPAARTPLIAILESGDPNMVIASERGLRAVGMDDLDPTCDRLIRVISSRSRLYSWFTHRTAIRVIGDLACKDAAKALEEYDVLLKDSKSPEGLRRFQEYVRSTPAPTPESIDLLQRDVDHAREVVKRTTGRTE